MIAVPVNTLLGVAAAWAITKFDFWGRRALLVTRSGRAFGAFLMDTSTLALTSVDISALADDMVEHPGFAYGNVRWQPGLCFTGGDRYILFPYLDGGTVLCELAETTENGGSTR